MEIVSYRKEYKEEFIQMNKAWIEEMFEFEKEDAKELYNIEDYLNRGSQIYFAIEDNEVMACCMARLREDGDYEIMKFATKDKFKGKGAGSVCLKACIDFIKSKGANKIIIVSNKRCESAIHLYRKFGFVEIPIDKKKFPFKRADIAFELYL